MAQLTLRTLLAYIDDTLEPAMARQLGVKVAESELALELIEKIKRVTRRRGLKAPSMSDDDDGVSDPNTVAEYLSNSLDGEQVTRLEETCLQSDSHLAEVAACHQILTLILTEPVRVPPQARQRMYKLVQPPLSDPNRRSRKAHPIGTVVPEPREGDADDADAAYLLGLGRYTAASVMKRVAAAAAVFVLCGCLAVAVIMALPGKPPEPPETDHHSYAANTTPTPPVAPTPVVPPAVKDPEPAPSVTPPKPKDPEPPVVPPKKGNEDLVKKIAAAKTDRVAIGKIESPNVIVVTRADDGPAWLRLDPGEEPRVTSFDQVLCLPGFKADVQLETGVKVHLWGSTPDPFGRLLESRVRFHVPERKIGDIGEDFDADITLLAGRIYLKSTKPAGSSRVRVRFAGQIWDVTLPDAKSEVMLELITAYDPGQPFSKEGGVLPRVDMHAAVLGGTAGIAMPERFKSFPKIATPSKIPWDSKTGALTEPKIIDMGNDYYERFPLQASDHGKAVQKALSEMAGRLKTRNGLKLMLAEILTEPADLNRSVAVMLAIHAQAAIANGPGAADELKPLIDLLEDEMKFYARLATVNALAAWIAQSPGNTAILGTALTAKFRNDQDPDIILRLLRGVVSPTKPDAKDLDRLVELLNHSSVAVRELALWNLVILVDPSPPKGLVTDVALAGTPAYEKFLKGWKAHMEEIKMKLTEKK